jgi:hypothetical protein
MVLFAKPVLAGYRAWEGPAAIPLKGGGRGGVFMGLFMWLFMVVPGRPIRLMWIAFLIWDLQFREPEKIFRKFFRILKIVTKRKL